ncbi:hypothetical protein TNCT_29221 [Trichonephila clavata]|uniref:Uncharacterized protein n=1 Tax=Trichonephila clavata TaxID=2740835 RepID=A0A8X6GP70_TRICU|nr:hypothetical protein TNCT_29221 [Trichonephila clavata]
MGEDNTGSLFFGAICRKNMEQVEGIQIRREGVSEIGTIDSVCFVPPPEGVFTIISNELDELRVNFGADGL